jgi:predicted metal-dependent hydrolase
MKIATRNLLAELLVRGLETQVAAAALGCLVTYGRAVKKTPPAMPVDRFLSPAPEAERGHVLQLLKQNPLLTWDLRGRSGRVTLASAFSAEWSEIIDKLLRYGAALEEWVSGETVSPLTNALRKGVLLFNYQLFFEVHEVLEAQWVRESGEERRFLQGLIQVAVAFYHLSNHNLRGALSLLHDGGEKIGAYQPVFLGIEVRDFLAELESCRNELLRLDSEELTHFPAEKIPRLQFAPSL